MKHFSAVKFDMGYKKNKKKYQKRLEKKIIIF